MLNFAASKEHLKYTLGLAAIGFAYAQTRLGKTQEIFGVEGALFGVSLAQWLLGLMLLLFLGSTLAAILAYSGIIRQEHEDLINAPDTERTELSASRTADGVALKFSTIQNADAVNGSKKDPEYGASRNRRISKVIRCTDGHLLALIVGFGLALVFFVGEALNPKKPVQICQSRWSELGGARISYPCEASPETIMEKGTVLP